MQSMPIALLWSTRLPAGKERLLGNSRSCALASHQKYPTRAAVPNTSTNKSNVGMDNPVGVRRYRLDGPIAEGTGVNRRTTQRIMRINNRHVSSKQHPMYQANRIHWWPTK